MQRRTCQSQVCVGLARRGEIGRLAPISRSADCRLCHNSVLTCTARVEDERPRSLRVEKCGRFFELPADAVVEARVLALNSAREDAVMARPTVRRARWERDDRFRRVAPAPTQTARLARAPLHHCPQPGPASASHHPTHAAVHAHTAVRRRVPPRQPLDWLRGSRVRGDRHRALRDCATTPRHAPLVRLMGVNPTPPPRPRGTSRCADCLATSAQAPAHHSRTP